MLHHLDGSADDLDTAAAASVAVDGHDVARVLFCSYEGRRPLFGPLSSSS